MKKRYFDVARKLSEASTHHQHKMGCVITYKNRIIGLGFNQLKTHSKSPHPYSSMHAELSAILNSDKDKLMGAKAYIFRAKRDGSPALAKPCVYCRDLLKSVGIKEVFYSINGSFTNEKY